MNETKPVPPLASAVARAQASIKHAVLISVVVVFSGCSSSGFNAPSALMAGSSSLSVPDELIQVSRSVKRNFIYNNDRPMIWPPIKNIDGIVVGNCMTYSRMVQTRLKALGLASRFRNVLAPVFPREHVVTVVTDRAGQDWVFDNRRPKPFPLAQLARYYDFEPGTHNAYVGAQRRTWSSMKTVKP